MKEYLINGKTFRLNVFEKITESSDAYLIGYLTGDGNFHNATHKRLARMAVSSINKDVIDFFKESYCPDSTVKAKLPINKKRNIVAKNLAYYMCFSSKFSSTFNKFGILCRKSDRVMCNIPKKFMPYYFMGLFDADGCWSWGYRKDRNRLWGKFMITHQSMKLLCSLQRYLSEELGVSTYIRPRSDENCMDLTASARGDLAKIIEWCYSYEHPILDEHKKAKGIGYLKAYKALNN